MPKLQSTSVRVPEKVREMITYLEERLSLKTLSAVLWYCVNRVYREEKAKEKKEG